MKKTLLIISFLFLFISIPKAYAGGGRLDFYFVSDHQNQSTGTPATLPDTPIQFKIVAWEDSNREKKSVGEHFDVKFQDEAIGDYCKMIQNTTNENGEAWGECLVHATRGATVTLIELDKHEAYRQASFETEYNLPPSVNAVISPTTVPLRIYPTNTPIPATPTNNPVPTVQPSPKMQVSVENKTAVAHTQIKQNIFQKLFSWISSLFK